MNDDEIIESAQRQLRADYYKSVRATADDIIRRMRAGEFDVREDAEDAVREATDETYWSIYYHAAHQCLQASDNEVNAWEEYTDCGYDAKGREILTCVAAIAHRLDVEEYTQDAINEYFDAKEES